MGLSLGSVFMKFGLVTDADEITVDAVILFVTLLCACIVIGHLLEENRWFNESITSLLIGLGIGVVILLTSEGKNSRILEFDEELFFTYLLPPIIFNAGFQMQKKQFFENFITIMLLGAVGTLISFAIIALGASQLFKKLNIGFVETGDYLAIGAILSATDSVCTLQVLNQDATPLLYSLVFGEGVVNDATSVVLFNAIQKADLSHVNAGIVWQFLGNFLILFITSTLLGILIGLLCAYIIKKLNFGRDNYDALTCSNLRHSLSTDREVALMALMAYLSYVMAEMFALSGILTVFFCGIVTAHYAWHLLTGSSKKTTKHGFATLSFVAEIFIFVYVGMDALDIEKWRFVKNIPGKSIGASSGLIGLVLVGRAAFVFPLSFLINLSKKSNSDKIEFKQQVTVWWAGLMRGAVSMALAYNKFANSGHTQLPGNAFMITSTITVVLFSTLVFGMITKPLLRFLLPPSNQSLHSMLSSELSSPKSITVPLLGSRFNSEADERGSPKIPRPTSLCMLLSTPTHAVHYYWRKFDNAFMRPVFGGRGFVPHRPDSPTEQNDHQFP